MSVPVRSPLGRVCVGCSTLLFRAPRRPDARSRTHYIESTIGMTRKVSLRSGVVALVDAAALDGDTVEHLSVTAKIAVAEAPPGAYRFRVSGGRIVATARRAASVPRLVGVVVAAVVGFIGATLVFEAPAYTGDERVFRTIGGRLVTVRGGHVVDIKEPLPMTDDRARMFRFDSPPTSTAETSRPL